MEENSIERFEEPVYENKSANTGTNSILLQSFFILLLLISLHFWNLKYIPQKFTLENIFVWIFCGICFFMVISRKGLRFKGAIILLVVGLLLNAYAAYMNFGQKPKLTILGFSFYYFILLYFVLHFFQLSTKFLENVIIVFAFIYAFIFTLQYKIYPYVIFYRDPKTAIDSRQLEIIGHGFLVLAYLLLVNRFLLKRKWYYILFAIALFLVLMKSDFRTLIAGCAFVTIVLVLRTFKFSVTNFMLIGAIALLFFLISQYHGVSYVINNMVNKTRTESREGKNYIRNIEIEFFYKKYPRGLSYYIIGGGKPSGQENIDNYNPTLMGMNYNIVWVDIGLLGFFVVVGGIALSGILLYTLKAIFSKLPRDKIYLSCYFIYLLIVSFTNEEIYRDGIFSVQAIALYLIDRVAMDKESEDPAVLEEYEASS